SFLFLAATARLRHRIRRTCHALKQSTSSTYGGGHKTTIYLPEWAGSSQQYDACNPQGGRKRTLCYPGQGTAASGFNLAIWQTRQRSGLESAGERRLGARRS